MFHYCDFVTWPLLLPPPIPQSCAIASSFIEQNGQNIENYTCILARFFRCPIAAAFATHIWCRRCCCCRTCKIYSFVALFCECSKATVALQRCAPILRLGSTAAAVFCGSSPYMLLLSCLPACLPLKALKQSLSNFAATATAPSCLVSRAPPLVDADTKQASESKTPPI